MTKATLIIGTLAAVTAGWLAFVFLPTGQTDAQYYDQNGNVVYDNNAQYQDQNRGQFPYDPYTGQRNANYNASTASRYNFSVNSNTGNDTRTRDRQERDRQRLCRTLGSYCRSQQRTNDRAISKMQRAGISKTLAEPPTCAAERDVCNGNVSYNNGNNYYNSSSFNNDYYYSSSSRSSSFGSGNNCFCTQQYDPVCGSDSHTYGNACQAVCAGVVVMHSGACAL